MVFAFQGQSIAHNAVLCDSVLVLLWTQTSTEISFKSKDLNGVTPLHLSCILGKTNCTKFLLGKYSNSDIDNDKTNFRDNCLHLSIKYQQLHCVPLILFNSNSSKKHFFCIVSSNPHEWNEKKPSILSAKNSEHKTPQDLFDELPQQLKDKNRIFTYLFLLIRLTSLQQIELNLFFYRLLLFFFPFLSFLLGIFLSVFLWPQYRTIIYPITVVICISFICSQSHRISRLDNGQNPIFAGAFLAGVLHDLLCFSVNSYTETKNDFEVVILAPLTLLWFAVCYVRLIVVHPGVVEPSEILTKDFSVFLAAEISKNNNNINPRNDICHSNKNNTNTDSYKSSNNSNVGCLALDRFCQTCELAAAIERVKHCKLCNKCVVNMDHHCLFVMKCIARNNIRNFIFLIISSLILITLFVKASLKTIITHCGPLSGSSPLPYLYCSYSSDTWVSVGLVFNVVSWVWGVAMLYNQLRMIGYNSTYYYGRAHNLRSPFTRKVYRVVYFMLKGRYYVSGEERRILTNI